VPALQEARRLGLALEARAHLGHVREVAVEELDRHEARDTRVRGAIDLTHASGGDALEDAVAAADDVVEERVGDVGAGADAVPRADGGRLEARATHLAVAHEGKGSRNRARRSTVSGRRAARATQTTERPATEAVMTASTSR
jgi:hypothetical protein